MTNHEKILVISDIHGALGGAQLMEEALRLHQSEKILCLGDILYHGPRNDVPEDYAPKKVIEIMNRYKDIIIAVRGNCEAEVDQMVLEFPCMSDANQLYLFGKKVCMSHGHIYSPANMPVCDVFLSGHTHIPTAEKKNGILLCNPGSASLPKNGHPCSYGILDENGFRVMRADHQEHMRVSY